MDIYSKADYPANALSNFYPHSFVMDGVKCASMEGFLQSLKFKDLSKQAKICALSGSDAKEAGLDQDWKSSQILHWQGKTLKRNSPEYQSLMSRAFDALAKNSAFKQALKQSAGHDLDHAIGLDDPTETVLTKQEFINQLYRVRALL